MAQGSGPGGRVTREDVQAAVAQAGRWLAPDNELLLRIYRTAVTTRALEDRLWILSRQGRVSFVLTAKGHDVAQIASAAAVRVGQDSVWPYYRDMAVGIAVGVTPYEILMGALARADDPHSGGRQLTMHLSSPRLKIGSISSEIAAHIPQAVGAAYAARVLGEDSVTFCWFGDGASSAGATHEAMNLASVRRLPVVFICENNGLAISVTAAEQFAVRSLAERGAAYDMPGVSLDGGDALGIFQAASEAAKRARDGLGPSLIELRVPRITSHSSQDDDHQYRSEQERAAALAADPLPGLRQQLLAEGTLSEAEDAAMQRTAAKEVLEAADRAMAQDEPVVSRARQWLFAGDAPHPFVHPATHTVIAGRDRARYAPAKPASPEGVTMVEALQGALFEEMDRDSSVVLLGEDVGRKGGVFKVSEGLQERFGQLRVLDTPLGEIGIAGAAIGAAMMGLRPVAEFQFADYIHPAYDQIVNQAATMRWRTVGAFGVPAVFRAPFGAGISGGLYHSQSVEALYCHIPGLKVVVPATPRDARGLLKAAIRDDDPVLFFEHKRSYRRYRETLPVEDEVIPIGTARLDREGSTLSVITYGVGVHLAREAADLLAGEGISLEILDLRTLAPFDREAIARTVRKTGKILILHEANKTMGIGAELSAFAAEELFLDLDAPVTRVAAADCHLPYNSVEEAAIIPGVSSVTDACRKLAAF